MFLGCFRSNGTVVVTSVALLPRVPVAGGFHRSSNCGVSDNRVLLQRESSLGRDEHQRGLVHARARFCHVSFYQRPCSRWFSVGAFLRGQRSHERLGAVFGCRGAVSVSPQWWTWWKQRRPLDHWVKHVCNVNFKLSFFTTVLQLAKYGMLSLSVGHGGRRKLLKRRLKLPLAWLLGCLFSTATCHFAMLSDG